MHFVLSSDALKEQATIYFELDPEANALTITGFKFSGVQEAERKYELAEEIVRDNPSRDAVLVSVNSVNALEKRYQKLFADTRIFVELLEQELSGREHGIQVPPLMLEDA